MSRFWKRITVAAIGVLVGEIGARIALPGVVSQVLTDFLRRGDAGFLIKLYDRLVGGGISRGAILALGIMPYASALICTGIVRRLGGRLTKNGTRGLTAMLSLVQGFGYAQFLESIPGAVVHPGAGFVAQTVIVLASSTLVAVALTEALFDRDADAGADMQADAQADALAVRKDEPLREIGPGRAEPVTVRSAAERVSVE